MQLLKSEKDPVFKRYKANKDFRHLFGKGAIIYNLRNTLHGNDQQRKPRPPQELARRCARRIAAHSEFLGLRRGNFFKVILETILEKLGIGKKTEGKRFTTSVSALVARSKSKARMYHRRMRKLENASPKRRLT